MTLVLGLVAKDGAVLVADGQATAGTGGMLTRTATQKIGALHGRVAYGCAGSAGLRQRVVESLEDRITSEACAQPITTLRPQLLYAVNVVQQQAASQFVRRDLMASPEGLAILFAGVSDDGSPWLYEITPNGEDEVHYSAEAIGTGRPYARYALMSAEHYQLRNRGLWAVRLLAYRAVDDAIRTDATDLGPPIGMYDVTRERARALTDDELKQVGLELVAWQGHEREVFQNLREAVGSGAAGSSSPRASEPGIEPPA